MVEVVHAKYAKVNPQRTLEGMHLLRPSFFSLRPLREIEFLGVPYFETS